MVNGLVDILAALTLVAVAEERCQVVVDRGPMAWEALASVDFQGVEVVDDGQFDIFSVRTGWQPGIVVAQFDLQSRPEQRLLAARHGALGAVGQRQAVGGILNRGGLGHDLH